MYQKRIFGPRGYRHDASSGGIFIHGGTCLMHGRSDPFRANAAPNHFTLTFPLVGEVREQIPPSQTPARTYGQALRLAESIRDRTPALHGCHIYACTDMIHEKPWSGSFMVQLVSTRKAARHPARNATTAPVQAAA